MTLRWSDLMSSLELEPPFITEAFCRYPASRSCTIELLGGDIFLSAKIEAGVIHECVLIIPQQFSIQLTPTMVKTGVWKVNILEKGLPSLFLQTNCNNRGVIMRIEGESIGRVFVESADVKTRSSLANDFKHTDGIVVDTPQGSHTIWGIKQ